MIKIVGLGPGSSKDLTMNCIEEMKNAKNLYFRTAKHPNVEYIRGLGIDFKTFDDYYDTSESFDEVYEKIARKIVELKDVVYAVPGHPLIAEKSVQLILEFAAKENIEVVIDPAISFIDAVVNTLKIDPVNGLKIIDGLELDTQRPDTNTGNIITQIYNPMVSSDIKIQLMNYYSDEQEVILVRGAGVPGVEKVERMPLYMIDRVDWVDYLTSLYIPKVEHKERYDFDDLLKVMATLRGENGCPWDREQNHESLKRYLIEECYEVVDAIDKKDIDALCEELGDVLLQIVFHAQIADEFGEFNITDVTNSITKKMISRHTHVFGDDVCKTAEDVMETWESNKLKEKHIESYTDNLKAIPKVLPALIRSYKIQEKAAKVGFDWDDVEGAVSKIHEETKEFLDVYKSQNNGRIIDELGDLLFAVVNVARFLDINPEFALTGTCEKFIKRFGFIESEATKKGLKLTDMSLEQMDELWNLAKSKLS